MNECVFNPQLQMLFNRYVLVSIFLVGLSFSLKDKRATYLALVTALSFWVGYSLQCDIKSLDPERVWRYVFWVGLDVIYLLVLVALLKLKKIKEWQFASICLLQVFVFLMQLMRVPDAHAFNYFYTDSFYSVSINIYNCLILLVVAMPALNVLLNKTKELQVR